MVMVDNKFVMEPRNMRLTEKIGSEKEFGEL
jgi:hypothetical protein